MRNRFNLNESEKSRIKGLHGIQGLYEQNISDPSGNPNSNVPTDDDLSVEDLKKACEEWEKMNYEQQDSFSKSLKGTEFQDFRFWITTSPSKEDGKRLTFCGAFPPLSKLKGKGFEEPIRRLKNYFIKK